MVLIDKVPVSTNYYWQEPGHIPAFLSFGGNFMGDRHLELIEHIDMASGNFHIRFFFCIGYL